MRTTWRRDVAMPHGWATAELALLMRDCLVFEDERRLVVCAGVPPQWFSDPVGMELRDWPTEFGTCSMAYVPVEGGAKVTIGGTARPADGFVLRLPDGWVSGDGLAAGSDVVIAGPGEHFVRFERRGK